MVVDRHRRRRRRDVPVRCRSTGSPTQASTAAHEDRHALRLAAGRLGPDVRAGHGRRDLLRRPLPRAPGRADRRRRADPRQHAARDRLGHDPVPDRHRARRLRRRGAARHREEASRTSCRCARSAQQFTWHFEYPRRRQDGPSDAAVPAEGPAGALRRSTPRTCSTSSGCRRSASRSTPCPGIRPTTALHARTGSATTRSSAPSCAASATRRCARRRVRHRRAAFKHVGRQAVNPASRRHGGAAGAARRRRSSTAPASRSSPATAAAAPATRSPTPARPARSGPDLDSRSRRGTQAFIKQSIVDPNAVDRDGFPENIMPQDFKQLAPRQVDALVKYLLQVESRMRDGYSYAPLHAHAKLHAALALVPRRAGTARCSSSALRARVRVGTVRPRRCTTTRRSTATRSRPSR